MKDTASFFKRRSFPQESWGHCDTEQYSDADL